MHRGGVVLGLRQKADHADPIDVDLVAQDDDVREPLGLETGIRLVQGRSHPRQMVPDSALVHDAPGPSGISGQDDGGGQVEHDGDGREAGGTGTGEQAAPRRSFDVRGIDNREAPIGESPRELAMKPHKGGPRRTLIRLIPGDQRSIAV